MDSELIKTVKDLIEFVNNASPIIWDALLRQQYVISICIFISLIVAVVGFLFGIKLLKNRPEWALDDMNMNVGGFLTTVVFGLYTVMSLIMFITNGIPKFLNPVYYALMALKP